MADGQAPGNIGNSGQGGVVYVVAHAVVIHHAHGASAIVHKKLGERIIILT